MSSAAAAAGASWFDGLATFLFAASFLQAFDNHLVAPLLPDFAASLGESAADRLLTAYALGAAVIPFVVASRMRRSARFALLPSLIVHGLASLAFVFAAKSGTTAAAFIARTAAGAASGVLSFALLAVAAEDDGPRRSKRIASQTAGFVSALVLGVPLGARLAEGVATYAPFAAAAVLAALLAVAAPFAAPARGAPPATPAPTRWRKLLRGRAPLAALGAALAMGAAVGLPTSRLGFRLKEIGGLDASDLGDVYLWAGVAPLAALPFASWLVSRFGAARVAVFGSLAFVGPTLWFARDDVATRAAAAAVLFVALLFETLRRSGLQSLMVDAVPSADRPRFLAFRGLCAQVGLGAGAAFAATLHRGTGFGAVCAASAALSVAGAGLAFAAGAKDPSADDAG